MGNLNFFMWSKRDQDILRICSAGTYRWLWDTWGLSSWTPTEESNFLQWYFELCVWLLGDAEATLPGETSGGGGGGGWFLAQEYLYLMLEDSFCFPGRKKGWGRAFRRREQHRQRTEAWKSVLLRTWHSVLASVWLVALHTCRSQLHRNIRIIGGTLKNCPVLFSRS